MLSKQKIHLNINHLPLFIAVSSLHLVASFLFTWGMRSQILANISIAHYSSLLFSIIIGWIFWKDLPSLNMIFAGLLIMIGNVALLKKI